MQGIISKYNKFLSHPSQPYILGMREGITPLLRSRCIASELGGNIDLFFKLENRNPSFSFKDRGVSNCVALAFQEKKSGVICASAGNLGVSCAMYAARAGMKCVVLVPKLFANEEKIRRMELFDAGVFILDADIADGLTLAKEFAGLHNFEFVWHGNERYLAGLKTIAFEICDELGRPPEIFSCGVGQGALISACWYGFKEYYSSGVTPKLPVMMGFMAEEAAGAHSGPRTGKTMARASHLNEISMGQGGISEAAVIARDESSGYIASVGDSQAAAVFGKMARNEAVLADVSSCVSVAGLYKLKADGVDFDNQTIVSIVAGAADSSEIADNGNLGVSHLKLIKPTVADLESEMVL